MIRKPRHARSAATTDRRGQPTPRLVRDVVEAEEVALDWLHWIGFDDARRVGDGAAAFGIQGKDVLADVSFDPLPLEVEVLADMRRRARTLGTLHLVSFSFAGWSPESFAWANKHAVALVRFTFAGSLDPSNQPARDLHRSR